MTKIAGYIVAFVGLFLLAISSGMLMITIPLISSMKPALLISVALALVILGVLLLKGNKQPHKLREVPVYEKEKVVAYRREK